MGIIPGIVHDSRGSTDYLYRVSSKAIIRDDIGNFLAVKEAGRPWWDFPGGGLDYGETVKECLERELKEEVGMTCGFTYRVIGAEDPDINHRLNVMQMNVICEVFPERFEFTAGEDGDEIGFFSLEQIMNDGGFGSRIHGHLHAVKEYLEKS